MGQALRDKTEHSNSHQADVKGQKVTDKSSFLMRGWAELRNRYHRLGIKLGSVKQDGTSDPIAKALYKEAGDWLRGASVLRNHRGWWRVYEPAYDVAYYDSERDGLTSRQAHKRARRQAEAAVVEAFPSEVTTTRTVRNALDYMHD